MGFIKDTKANVAGSHAARAAQEGRRVLLYRYDVPATSSGFSGPVSGAAEVIESIEGQGWHLSDMAYDGKQARNGAVVLLFRRSANNSQAAPAHAERRPRGNGQPGRDGYGSAPSAQNEAGQNAPGIRDVVPDQWYRQ
jgi:hypothetical protein